MNRMSHAYITRVLTHSWICRKQYDFSRLFFFLDFIWMCSRSISSLPLSSTLYLSLSHSSALCLFIQVKISVRNHMCTVKTSTSTTTARQVYILIKNLKKNRLIYYLCVIVRKTVGTWGMGNNWKIVFFLLHLPCESSHHDKSMCQCRLFSWIE